MNTNNLDADYIKYLIDHIEYYKDNNELNSIKKKKEAERALYQYLWFKTHEVTK